MADKKKSKLPEKSEIPITKWEIPIYKGDGSNELNNIHRYGYSEYDRDLNKLLEYRMKKNEEMGLKTSPDDTRIKYGEQDKHFYSPNKRAYVHPDNPKVINIHPLLRKTPENPTADEDELKFVIAHELQHVNQFANKDERSHEKDEYVNESDKERLHYLPPLFSGSSDRYGSEKLRRLRSLMHPYIQRLYIPGLFDYSDQRGKTVFDVQKVLKYAKEQGVPVDDIIDAMTINDALSSDELAKDAHYETLKNQEVGRGILGDVGLEKPMSTEDVYKPWKEMRKKRLKKKFYSGGGV